MNAADTQYLDLCRHILAHGTRKDDRTGTGTLSTFGYQMRFDLSQGFPLLTTKRVPFRIVAEELLWFISGSTDVKPLLDAKVDIWTRDAYALYKRELSEWGRGIKKFDPVTLGEYRTHVSKVGADIGPIYGKQWRSWPSNRVDEFEQQVPPIDQLAQVIESLRTNPDSRRHLVSAWNVSDLDDMALPPCHTLFQFYVADGKLSCQLYQRSADVFLGVPFNIASYALLTHMIAHVLDLEVGEFIHTLGDAHIYVNHIDQVTQQLEREPRSLPQLFIEPHVDDIDDFTIADIDVWGYDPHPPIKGEQSA